MFRPPSSVAGLDVCPHTFPAPLFLSASSCYIHTHSGRCETFLSQASSSASHLYIFPHRRIILSDWFHVFCSWVVLQTFFVYLSHFVILSLAKHKRRARKIACGAACRRHGSLPLPRGPLVYVSRATRAPNGQSALVVEGTRASPTDKWALTFGREKELRASRWVPLRSSFCRAGKAASFSVHHKPAWHNGLFGPAGCIDRDIFVLLS